MKYEDLTDTTRVGLFGQNDVIEFGFIAPDTLQIWSQGIPTNLDYLHDIEAEEWVHIVAVGDGEELRLYIDGEEVAAGGAPLRTDVEPYGADNDFPFNIGGGGIWDDAGNQFYGSMANIAVWDRALTAVELQAQMNAAMGMEGIAGDYNGNGELDVEDLDLQAVEIAGGQDPPAFDLTGDGLVNEDDRIFWLHDLKSTWVGDADLDGFFDSADFVAVFVEGKYETGEGAGWAQGDWNADLVFDSGDFVSAFVDGGYEIGAFPGAVKAVPEPSSLMLTLLSLAGLLTWTRRR